VRNGQCNASNFIGNAGLFQCSPAAITHGQIDASTSFVGSDARIRAAFKNVHTMPSLR
jgi:hypothetical protein